MRNDFAHVYMDGEYAHRFPDHHNKRRPILDEDGCVLPGSKAYRDPFFGWREGRNLNYRLVSRFLGSRVGRLWDDVLSEASSVLRGARLRHDIVYDLNRSYRIERGCIMVDGEVCDSRGRPVDGFYVHPETGILSQTSKEGRNHRYSFRQKHKDLLDPDSIHLTSKDDEDRVSLLRIKGEWFHRSWHEEVVERTRYRQPFVYHSEVVKRQLSRRDIVRLCLRDWTRLSGELAASIDEGRPDEDVVKRLRAIRKDAIKHYEISPSSGKG